jgi:HEAT repeat protein
MWALAANPLLLSLMAFAFEQDGELPEGRAGLYGRGVELLLREKVSLRAKRSNLEGEDHREGLVGDLRPSGRAYSLTTEQKRSLLEEVALHFHLRRAFLFPEDELRGIITDYLPTLLSLPALSPVEGSKGTVDISIHPEQVRDSVLEQIGGQHGLLREQIGGWYGFPHPTWQEYLAAAAIGKSGVLSPVVGGLSRGRSVEERGQLEWVLEGLHDPWWEGTVLFLAGVLENATPFLEGILAQEEDIFHSNLLLAGRCLAVSASETPPTVVGVEGVGLDIIERLKGLVEGGHHRLLQQQAIPVLAEIGGGAVLSFFVTLLRRKEIVPAVLAQVAKVLGSLHPFDGVYPEQSRRAQDRGNSVVPDLLAFLTEKKLDPSVRGSIAEALGTLGDESVIPPLLALLPDETVDPSVRGRVVEALVTLGVCPEPGRRDESIVSHLLAFLPDEGIDPTVRERIIEVLASLLGVGGVSDADRLSCQPFDFAQDRLVLLLSDEKIHSSVRQAAAEAVGSLGDELAVPDLLALLSDERIEPSVRGKAAEALGALGAPPSIPPLLALLGDEKVNYSVRMVVAEVLGVLGARPVGGVSDTESRRDKSVASQLLTLLSDEKIDPDVRASIAGALGVLGDKTMVPQLLSLLPDERIDPAVRWRIVDALSSLGDKTIIPHLRALLPNENIDSSVRWMVAEALEALAEEKNGVGGLSRGRGERAEITENGVEGLSRGRSELGSLDDRSRVPQFLALLEDEGIDPSVSGRIIEALGSLGDDRVTVKGLTALLDREDIGSRVYEALFHVSQRAGMRVFARKGQGYGVRPFDPSTGLMTG